jgi:hypothetical protein
LRFVSIEKFPKIGKENLALMIVENETYDRDAIEGFNDG